MHFDLLCFLNIHVMLGVLENTIYGLLLDHAFQYIFLFKPSFYKFVQVTFLVMLDKIILTSLEQNKFGFLYTKLHINVYLNPLFDKYVQQLPSDFKTLVLAYLFAIIQTFVWINLKKNVLKKVIFISTLLIKTI